MGYFANFTEARTPSERTLTNGRTTREGSDVDSDEAAPSVAAASDVGSTKDEVKDKVPNGEDTSNDVKDQVPEGEEVSEDLTEIEPKVSNLSISQNLEN